MLEMLQYLTIALLISCEPMTRINKNKQTDNLAIVNHHCLQKSGNETPQQYCLQKSDWG